MTVPNLDDRPVVHSDVDRVAPEIVKGFAERDIAAVHESSLSHGLLGPEIRSMLGAGVTLCGPAVTAYNAPGDNLAMHAALDLTQEGDVLVVACASELPAATWGGMACTAAAARGLAGVVTDGYARDLPHLRRLGFPTWARGASPAKANKSRVWGVNVPVVLSGVRIAPGDLVMADEDGVVVVPKAEAPKVLEAAIAREKRENEMEIELGKGRTPFDLSGMAAALREAGVRFTGSRNLGEPR
jgi:4-hydroxy-4-methyl-2-oxoglutarate aldolase